MTAIAAECRSEPWHLSFAPLADALLPQLTPEVIAAALASAPLQGQEIVLRLLPEIHRRYVRAVAAPSAAALAATRLAGELYSCSQAFLK